VTDVTTPDGGRIAYEVRGRADAQTLLLCRPLGGSMVSWARFGDVLAERMRVIAFDARGTGQSSTPRLTTSTRTMAQDAVTVLDALGIARAHVYGISLGGMVASWLAVDWASRVDRLVLASTTPIGLTFHASASRRLVALARCFTAKTRFETEACMATRILSREFRRDHPSDVEKIRALARVHPATRRSLLVLLAAAGRHDLRGRLKDITARTLVLAGSRDELITLAPQRRMAMAIPHAKLEVIADAGHDISAEVPEEVAARVLSHLRANPE
jgi:3-oxoadipate enol-lactonase